MFNPKVQRVPVTGCITTTCGRFEEFLRLTGRCGVEGSGGANSSQPRCRSVGAGCGTQVLRAEKTEGSWIEEEAWNSSKVPGRQTVPRAEIWAILMVLMVWDGTYNLTIVTDASYTVRGIGNLAGRKDTRGPNWDI